MKKLDAKSTRLVTEFIVLQQFSLMMGSNCKRGALGFNRLRVLCSVLNSVFKIPCSSDFRSHTPCVVYWDWKTSFRMLKQIKRIAIENYWWKHFCSNALSSFGFYFQVIGFLVILDPACGFWYRQSPPNVTPLTVFCYLHVTPDETWTFKKSS